MRTSILAVMVIIGWASAATAAPITFNFTATQISAQTPGGLASLAAPFATITGSFTYDTAVPASTSNSVDAQYPTGALFVTQFNVGTGVFSAPFQIVVINNVSPSGDAFQLLTGGAAPGTPQGTYDLVSLTLSDTTGTALTSTALPNSLSLFASSNSLTFQRFSVDASGGSTFLGATNYGLTSLQLAPTTVPEPATMVLLCSGLAAAGLRRRLRKRA